MTTPMNNAPQGPQDQTPQKQHPKPMGNTASEERALEEGLEQSFPGSDPVAIVQPHRPKQARGTASGQDAQDRHAQDRPTEDEIARKHLGGSRGSPDLDPHP